MLLEVINAQRAIKDTFGLKTTLEILSHELQNPKIIVPALVATPPKEQEHSVCDLTWKQVVAIIIQSRAFGGFDHKGIVSKYCDHCKEMVSKQGVSKPFPGCDKVRISERSYTYCGNCTFEGCDCVLKWEENDFHGDLGVLHE